MDLAEKLLVLADAAAGDGAQGLLKALRTILSEVAPFDVGEAVLVSGDHLLRWRLDDRGGELLGADVVRHIGTLHAPLRFDELEDATAFPETHQALVAQGMRSLLVLPFQGGGALAIARRYGWAFVGASMHHLWPLRGMVGIGLRQAVLLTGLAQKVDLQEAELERANATPDELRARLERSQTEVREREAQRAAANAGWEATRAELRETARGIAAAEEAARSLGEARARAEERAEELSRRLGEETHRREAGEADAQRRQAEADERLGRLEGERQALAVEVEALRRESQGTGERAHEASRERDSLRAALAEQEKRLAALEQAIAIAEEARAESLRARDEALHDSDRWRREAESARAAAEEAARRCAQLEADAASARGETEHTRAGLEQEHHHLEALRREAEESRREAEALHTRLGTEVPALEAENRVLKNELAAARDETAKLLHAAQKAEARPKVAVTKRRRTDR